MPDEPKRTPEPEPGAGPVTVQAGDVVLLTRAASPQFVRPITVRVIRELPGRYPYDGWFWFEGYELDVRGDAVRRRELYALRIGVRRITGPRHEIPAVPAPARRRAPARTAVRS